MRKKILASLILFMTISGWAVAGTNAAETLSKTQITRSVYHVVSAPSELLGALAAEPVKERTVESWIFGMIDGVTRTAIKLVAGAVELAAWTADSYKILDKLV